MADKVTTLEDRHREVRELLPWFVTGGLEPDERARIAAHLEVCAQCAAQAQRERRLEAEIASLPLGVEAGWNRLRQDIERPVSPLHALAQGFTRRAPWLGWGVAASLAVGIAVVLSPAQLQPQTYHTLSSASPSPRGDILVAFSPSASLAAVNAALNAGDLRIVDGPTAGGAYVLRAPAGRRAAVLAALRRQAAIMVAEPIGEPTP